MILFAHPRQGWDAQRVADACTRLAQITRMPVESGREAHERLFPACRRSWDRWTERVGRGVALDGTPLYNVFVVPEGPVARATAQIVTHALDAGRDVLAWDVDGTGGCKRVIAIRDEAPGDEFFGWRLVTE